MNIKTKICKWCWAEKPETVEFFSIVKNKRPDGTSYTLFRWKCKKCMVKNVRSWQKDNPEMKSKTDKERSERLKNAPWSHTKEDISVIRISQNNKCYYCANTLDETQEKDHKISLLRWWTNNPDNIVLACRSCNRDKHNKTVEEFFQWRIENGLSVNNGFYF